MFIYDRWIFRPANKMEIAEFFRSLENRATNTLIAIQSAKQALAREGDD